MRFLNSAASLARRRNSAPTIWDPARTYPALTVTNGGLTVERPVLTPNTYESAQATNPRSGGRRYVEVYIDNYGSGGNTMALGLTESAFPTVNEIIGFSSTPSVGFLSSGSAAGIYYNGVQTPGSNTATGVYVCFDMNLDTEEFSYRIDNGSYVGPVAFPLMTGPYYFTYVGRNAAITKVTANFGATPFAFTPPVGAISWNA